MRKATWEDKTLVVKIILETFKDNPGVLWMFRDQCDTSVCLKRLADFAFVKSMNRDGVYVSDNNKGVALCYQWDLKYFSWRELMIELKFAISCIGLFKLSKVLKRESVRKSIRPADGRYLYFWFFGVGDGGDRAAWDLKNGLMQMAKKIHYPIYLETTVLRNVMVYQRIGFKTYQQWHDDKNNIHFWFMKWENE